MPVEIPDAVLVQGNPGSPSRDRRIDVGSVGFALVVLGYAERRQCGGQLSVSGRIRLQQMRAETPDAVRAKVALARYGIAVGSMRLCKGSTAEATRLLGPEPDHANRSKRPACIHDVFRRSRRDRDARAVVDRSRALVPTVEMAPDEQDGCLGIAPGNFRDNI